MGAGLALDGCSIGVSKIIELSAKLIPGIRDSRLFHSAGGSYARMVGIAEKMSVVLYDVGCARAWLVSGADALLHLSRAALTSPHAPRIPDNDAVHKFVHRDGTIPGRVTASDILLEPSNRGIVLYEDERDAGKAWRFEDLVLEHWALLEEMKSHQAKLKCSDPRKWELKNPFSTKLEGFGFNDRISGDSPFSPRFAQLKESGANWLRFTTQSGAINILGSSFGELFTTSSPHCTYLGGLPCGADFLAAPLERIFPIAQKYGDISSPTEYVEVVRGVFWNDPGGPLRHQCSHCTNKDRANSCSLAMTQLSGGIRFALPKPLVRENIFTAHPLAAVIIGRQSAVKRLPKCRNHSKTVHVVSQTPSHNSDSGVDVTMQSIESSNSS